MNLDVTFINCRGPGVAVPQKHSLRSPSDHNSKMRSGLEFRRSHRAMGAI